MDAIKQKVTGGAYDKPAKTKDGAMTTQDSADAHTIEGTTADPNVGTATSTAAGDKAQELKERATGKASQAKETADDKGVTQKAKETADDHGVGNKARQAEQKVDESAG